MKRIKIYFPLVILLFCCSLSYGQDSLFKADLSKHVSHFQVEAGQFSEEVQNILSTEAIASQHFVLGEYHGSPRISEFTAALIPLLDKANYKTMALEVGPVSVKILDQLSKPSEKTVRNLFDFNTKYKVTESDGYVYTAIPFFENKEDADFLAAASAKQWNLLGLDQEFIHGYIPLIDQMYANLSPADQQKLKVLHSNSIDSIQLYYEQDEKDIRPLTTSIKQSNAVQSFLEKAAGANNKNKVIYEAIQATTKIYHYNTTRKYYACNSTRINYMKENLRKGFEANNFDLSSDKMLLKMGGIHTARGFSRLSLFEVGNLLSELAEYHGSKSTHLYFFPRFYMEEGKLSDELADSTSYGYHFYDLLQFGKKDEWTLIDLRPTREATFYWRRYKLNDYVLDIIKHHDFLIIPKLDTEGTPNYK